MVALVFATASRPPPATQAAVAFTAVQSVIAENCTVCHSQAPTHEAFPQAPKGFMLDTPTQIATQAERIYTQTVVSRAMPLGNITEITEQERALIGQWFQAGAAVE